MRLMALFTVSCMLLIFSGQSVVAITHQSCEKVNACHHSNQEKDATKQNPCGDSNTCNPLNGCCATCFYLNPAEQFDFILSEKTIARTEFQIGSVSSYIADCWQPPEFV
jgi:hypothetical protein